MQLSLLQRGFLPIPDPARSFQIHAELAMLDELGHDLPSLLHDAGFRERMRSLRIPPWPEVQVVPETLDELRLYYVRLGFLASAYVNQVGQERATVLPRRIAQPLCAACRLLERPPILSYDGYALYNWKRFDPAGPIALGNIDTIQNFVHMYDEHWFILVHVEIEALAADILRAITQAHDALRQHDAVSLNTALTTIGDAVWRQTAVLQRIPEHMDPALYHKTFLPYIRFLENVIYEGVDDRPVNYRGETGAQSSIMPLLIALMKIPHQQSQLTNHLRDMRRFMPAEHRAVIAEVEALPSVRDVAQSDAFNNILDAMAVFRETHYRWAQEYINKWADDPRGTGGTPYMHWLKQLIDETRAWRL